MEKGRTGESYNIGSGNERRNIDVAKTILDILGKPHSLIEFVQDRPGHDIRYSLNFKKITRELGWKPAYDFENGMRATIQWYLENRQWWERVKSGEYKEFYARWYEQR